MLTTEFHWYRENQEELLKKYNGRVVAIKNKKVIGDFPNYGKAYTTLIKDHKVGTFLLQLCTPGKKDFTQKFLTRAKF